MLLDTLYQFQNYPIVSIPILVIYPDASEHSLTVHFKEKKNQINVVRMRTVFIFGIEYNQSGQHTDPHIPHT